MSYDTTKMGAEVEGSAVLAVSGLGEGWRVYVWENLGWHWALESPCLHWRIHPHRHDWGDGGANRRRITGFGAFLNAPRVQGPDEPSPGELTHATGGRWVGDGATVLEAMAAARCEAQEQVDETLAILASASLG